VATATALPVPKPSPLGLIQPPYLAPGAKHQLMRAMATSTSSDFRPGDVIAPQPPIWAGPSEGDFQIEGGTFDIVFGEHDEMWKGRGDRDFYRRVWLKPLFQKQPAVQVSLYGIDVDQSHNTRVQISVEQVNGGSDFLVRVHTWADTKIWSVRVTWTAYGRHSNNVRIEGP